MIIRPPKLIGSFCWCALMFTSACSTTVNTVERAQVVGERQMVDDKRIVTDTGLARRVAVVGVNESTGAGGLLKAQVEVLNTTRFLQHFNYKFEWFDEYGNLVGAPSSAFLPRQIEGKESMFLSATAPTAKVKDFRLKLLENLR